MRETDRCIQLADGFLILAEKELSAFIRAVDKLFGAEQARQSALHWIEVLERMDWPSGESIPDWRRATVGASARLSALLSGSGEPELWQARKEIPVSKCCLRCTGAKGARAG